MLKIRVVIEDGDNDTLQVVFEKEKQVDIKAEQSKEIQKVFSEILSRIDEFY